jgi:hypothetical protein
MNFTKKNFTKYYILFLIQISLVIIKIKHEKANINENIEL